MTFGAIVQRVYDKLGLTAEATMVASMVNEAAQEIASAAPWRFLEETQNHLWTTSQSLYTVSTNVGYVLMLHASTGWPLDIVSQHLFKDMYRGDTSTAGYPYVATMDGMNTTGQCTFRVWPTPSANSTGTCRYLRRIDPMSTTADVPQIPTQWHQLIVDGALSRFANHEDHEQLQAYRAQFDAGLEKMKATEPQVVVP